MYTLASFVEYFVFPLVMYLLAALAVFVCLWTTDHPIVHNYDIWWEFANFMALLSVVMQMLQGRLWLYRYTDGQDAAKLHALQSLLLAENIAAEMSTRRPKLSIVQSPRTCLCHMYVIHLDDRFALILSGSSHEWLVCPTYELTVKLIKLALENDTYHQRHALKIRKLAELKAVLLHNHYSANLNLTRSPTLCIDLPTVGPRRRRVNIIHQNGRFQVRATNGDFIRCVSTELVVEYIKLLDIYYALQCHLPGSEQHVLGAQV